MLDATKLMKLSVLPPLLLTTACSISAIGNEANDSALCESLSTPVDTFAETLLTNAEKTPAAVVTTGVTVVKGFDAGCS